MFHCSAFSKLTTDGKDSFSYAISKMIFHMVEKHKKEVVNLQSLLLDSPLFFSPFFSLLFFFLPFFSLSPPLFLFCSFFFWFALFEVILRKNSALLFSQKSFLECKLEQSERSWQLSPVRVKCFFCGK